MKSRFYYCVPVTFILLASQVYGQESSDTNWQSPYSKIEIVDGKLAGPGRDAFLKRCQESNYVLFGEAHGVHGVAEFVAATHFALNENEFHHLVMESGDWFTSRLAAESTERVLEMYPYSLAFDYDGDIQMIAQAETMAGTNAPRFIGIDQEVTAIHPLQFLGTEAKSRAARRLSRGLHLKALFQAGRYVKSDHFADLEKLKLLVDGDPGSKKLVTVLEDSMTIYFKHVSGEIDDSVSRRELRMMSLFDMALAEITEKDVNARFIFKMGGAHVARGVGPNGIKTVGEHVAQVAIVKGQKTLHIGIHPWKENDAIPLPDEARKFPFVFVDSVALRKQLTADNSGSKEQPELTKELAARLNQFDAFILIPDAQSASKGKILSLQGRFLRRSLLPFLSFLIPLFMLVPVYWSACPDCLAWLRRTNDDHDFLLRNLPAFVSLGMLVLIIWQISLSVLAPSSAGVSSDWFLLLLDSICVLSIFSIGIVVLLMHTKRWWAKAQKVLFWFGFVACVFLWAYMYYWNIGGLLGI